LYLLSLRLGENTKNTATTNNAIAKEIAAPDQFQRAADLTRISSSAFCYGV
jgi:hypothetical protein